MPDNEPTTHELRVRQRRLELAERRRAEEADSGADIASHQRRADKAEYLREKLEEREESERQTPTSDRDNAR